MLTRRPLQHLEVFEGIVHDGAMVGSRTHSHGDSQELLLVLEGSVRLILDDEEHAMDSGDSIEYRSSSTHCVGQQQRDGGSGALGSSVPRACEHFQVSGR